jgi:large subunit ribosomal protein L15
MKLHDLHPAPGSHKPRTRVGRGIAAGKGKTAGRGTKGQKARAGGSIPPWFEGGQTPLHQRIPKLRGFKNRFKIHYEVVNVGDINARAERGAFDGGEPEGAKSKSGKAAPPTVNQEILRAVGLVRTISKPLKVLGAGELSRPFFVVADAFTKSAIAKIEAAGGTVSVLEVPDEKLPAIGVGDEARTPREPRTAAGRVAAGRKVDAREARAVDAAERAAEAATAAPKGKKQKQADEAATDEAAPAKAKGADRKSQVTTSAAETDAPDADVPDADATEAAESAIEAPDAVEGPEVDTSASPLEAGDATAGTDGPAGDAASEADPTDDENA